MASGSIDVDKPGKYPIVLSDALLGKPSKEVYTGIRCTSSPSFEHPNLADSIRQSQAGSLF